MVMCSGQVIKVEDLPHDFKNSVYEDNRLHLQNLPTKATLYETLVHVEKEMILRALREANYVQSHAAALLGIGKSGLNQKIKKHGIEIFKTN
jgi:two-component system NtrC family response regulator